MPHISGFDVCSILRETHSANDLPVIFLTAKNQVSDMVEGFTVGANDYLSKPVNKYELLTRVENHLKFLEIHRDLEGKVTERTEQLEQKNQLIEQKRQELEIKNKEIELKHQQLEAKAKLIAETQEQLVQAEKMASLGTLTAGVAHELNNPNNFIHISVQNLKDDLIKAETYFVDLAADQADEELLAGFRQQFVPLENHLEIIKDGAKRIKDIVLDLHTFSQLDAAEQQTVDISDLVQVTVNLVRTQYQKEVTFDLHLSEHPQLHCNPAQLNQVLMNFIVNGCEAIARRDDPSHQGQITVECHIKAETVEITIKDNGCGMTEETQNKLFEPFYTTKTVGDGTGLGLSIAFGIIQQHDGEIQVESQLGVGTTFVISLPNTTV
jgi:signal transduction histidine kinase